MYRLFYLWHNGKLFLYFMLTIHVPSTFLHIMYMYNMNQFEINHLLHLPVSSPYVRISTYTLGENVLTIKDPEASRLPAIVTDLQPNLLTITPTAGPTITKSCSL